MATPTLVLINNGGLTDGVLSDADTNTGWTNLTVPDTDIKVEGTGSESGITRTDGEDSYYDAGSAPVTAVGKVLRGWVNTTNIPYMAPEATNPYELWVFDGTSQSPGKALFGSDTYPGGWFYFWQDMDDFGTVTLANVDRWGIEAGHASSAKNATNMWMDVLRYMDGYYMTGGTSGDKIGMVDVAGVDLTAAYGIVRNNFEVYFCTGEVQIGNGATTTWFEMNGEVFVFLDTPGALSVSAGLYELNVQGSGCDCDIKNSVLRANGTGDTTRFVIDFSDTNATLSFTDNLVTRAGAVTLASGQAVTGNIFDDCGLITHAAADMSGCVVKNYVGTAGTAAVLYNVNADPNGEVDDMEFVKGASTCHAIELGSNCPSSITLRGWTVTGYNASNGQNDSVIYNNSGKAITVNVADNTGTISYRNGTSASTTISADPVTTTITVVDSVTKAAVTNARVYLVASAGTGPLPYEQTITSINRSGATATVVCPAVHGLTTGDVALIEGATEDEYNGAFVCTVTSTTEFTYTVPGTPSTPAGGTKTVTGGYFNELTTGTGIITDSRSIGTGQPMTGWVRKTSASPYYKTSGMDFTVDNALGYTITVQLIPDE